MDFAPIAKPPRQGQIPSPLYTEICDKSAQFLIPSCTNIPFFWDQHAQDAFYALKQALDSAPLLSAPDFTKDFILYVSASKNAIAGVLVQEDDAHQEHVIYYVSQKLTSPPLRYSTEENMALAIVFLIQNTRHYIIANHT